MLVLRALCDASRRLVSGLVAGRDAPARGSARRFGAALGVALGVVGLVASLGALGCTADQPSPLGPRLAGSPLDARLRAHSCSAGDEPGAACSMPEVEKRAGHASERARGAAHAGHDVGALPKGALGKRAGVEGARREAGMPRLLELEMPGCTACAKMAPVVKSVEARCSTSDGAPRAPLVEHVDVTDEEGEALAKRHGVKSLPTFLALDAEGDEVMRLVGLQEPEALATLVAEVTGRACCATSKPC